MHTTPKSCPAGQLFGVVLNKLFPEIVAGPGEVGTERHGGIGNPQRHHPSADRGVPSLNDPQTVQDGDDEEDNARNRKVRLSIHTKKLLIMSSADSSIAPKRAVQKLFMHRTRGRVTLAQCFGENGNGGEGSWSGDFRILA